jgi:hypothetical protein
MKCMREDIVRQAVELFRLDAEAVPPLTLRGGSAVDTYHVPPAFDPDVDRATDAYLEEYAYLGLTYLDPASWRHYLPCLMDYAIRHIGEPGSLVTDGLLSSLRPPDREPPRLGSISAEQEAVVVEFLDLLAFDERSGYQDFAMQVLDEYWVPNALYRPRTTGPA